MAVDEVAACRQGAQGRFYGRLVVAVLPLRASVLAAACAA